MIKAARGKPLRINMAAYRVLCDLEFRLAHSRAPWSAEEIQEMKRQMDAVLTQAQGIMRLNDEQLKVLDHANRHGRYTSLR